MFPGILLQQAAYPSHKSINQSIQSQFCSDCSIRVSRFSCTHEKIQLLNFKQSKSCTFLLGYDFQAIVSQVLLA